MHKYDRSSSSITLLVVAGLSLALGLLPGQKCYAIPEPASAKAPSAAPDPAPHPKSLSLEEQRKFLLTRLPGNVIGNFGGFASLLYEMEGALIGSASTDVLHRPLHTIFPDKVVYMPTYGEFFEMIARQTHTSFKYEPEVNVWLFDEPSMPLPYTMTKAAEWQEEDRGTCVTYVPQLTPTGLDIYMMGRYSDISDAQLKKVRDILALRFSKHIDANVAISDMKAATVDGADAIYFDSAAPEAGRRWRQWAFCKDGQAYVIVSSYGVANKDKVVPEVDGMVRSFHVRERTPG